MKKKIKNLLLIVGVFLCGGMVSVLMPLSEETLLVDNEFLITFIGVVLGISTTIITFIFSSTEKIWKVIGETYGDIEKSEKAQKLFKNGYQELIEDSTFIFVIFVILIFLVFYSAIDIPYITFPPMLCKKQILNFVKMGLFFNCLIATCDLFFSLSNILKLVLYERGKASK